MELENQRYGRNKHTLINKTYIASGAYRKKFDKISNNSNVNRTIYNRAKEMLNHRSGTMFEDMYWIDGNTGKVIAKEISGNTEQKIYYSDATKKVISANKNKELITIHNHPSSMPPSVADFNSCYRNGYKCGYIVCHNGKIYAYTSQQMINEKLYNLYIGEYIDDGLSEFEAQLKTIEKLKKNHSIDFWEVT